MKKSALLVGLLVSISAHATDLPFIGKRDFSFGGVPAYNVGYEIAIQPNGLTTLKSTTCYSQHCDKSVLLYRGKFSHTIGFKEDGDQWYIKVTKNKVYLLDEKKSQARGCDTINDGSETEPCISTYY